MTPAWKARLIAAVATPLLVLHGQPARCQAAATPSATVLQTDHLSIVRTGSGTPVILIPGLSSPRAVYDGVAAALARTHSVYLVQINGFGGDDPRGNLKPGILDGAVADLDAYIAANKLQGAAVIGHSMGGLIGLMLAKAHPADLGKLMLVDTLPFVADIYMPGLTVAEVAPRAARMRDAMIAHYGQPFDDATADRAAMRYALKPEARAQVKAWMKLADLRVVAQATYEDGTTDLHADLPAIQTPITLVYPYGANSLKEKDAAAFYREEYAKAPRVTFVPVADAAHFVMLDQPEAFRAAVLAFAG